MPTEDEANIIFAERLKRLMDATESRSDSDLARALGVIPQSVKGAKDRRKIPLSWIETISASREVSADWLLYGRGERSVAANRPISSFVMEAARSDYGLILIKKVSARLSAGGGSFETDDDVTGLYAFREDWIRSKGRPESLVLMDVSGESMHPLIENADTVLINTAKNALIDGKIYAVAVEEQVFVKEYARDVSAHLFRSVNERYPVLRIDPQDESIHWKVIGQVIWVCRELF